ncbi:MAG: hypothetical protein Q8P50_00750 [Bacillota bacterium]|nr:hypothetical protein [Bacillota bacterium]
MRKAAGPSIVERLQRKPRRAKRRPAPVRGELLSALSPVMARLRLRHWATRLAQSLLAGELLALAVSLYSLIVPVPERVLCAVYAAGLGVLGWLASGVWTSPTAWDAVRAGDAAGLEERLVTAVEFASENGPIFVAQREDALARVKSLDPAQAFPIRFKKSGIASLGAVLLATTLLLSLPYRFQREVDAYAAFREEAQTQAEELRARREAVEKAAAGKTDVAKTIKELKELEERLRSARTPEQALRALSEAEARLAGTHEPARAQTLQQAMRSMAGALGESSALRDAASKMAAGDWPGAAESLRKVAQELGNLDSRQLAQAEQALQKAAGQARAAGAAASGLAQSATSAAQATGSGDPQSAADALEGLAEQVEGAGSEVDSQQAAQAALAAISNARYGLLSQSASAQGSGQGSGQGGTTPGPGSGTGGQGASGAAGISNAAGTGQGASGAGQGSTNQASGQAGDAPGTTAGSGSSPPPSKRGSYEKIYSPEHLGGDSAASPDTGKPGSGPSDFIETPGGATTGKSVPYSDVFYDFQRRAAESLERSQIPAGMRDFVRKYFSALEPAGDR